MMTPAETLVFNTIVEMKPHALAEVGSGSMTIVMASALKQIDHGILYTYNKDKDAFKSIVNELSNKKISIYVRPYNNNFYDGIGKILVGNYNVAYVGGKHDVEANYSYLRDHMLPGSCLFLGNWGTGTYDNQLTDISDNWNTVEIVGDVCKLIKK